MAGHQGWDAETTAAFKTAFSDFLRHVKIISKDESGPVPLIPFGSQQRFLAEVFEGLSRDIHWFVVLKARQLGISTVVRALILFWAFMHKGARIALIYDTDSNKEDARAEIKMMLRHLPPTHRVRVKDGGDNRNYTEFENESRISYMVAGIKKSKSSGGLGRSRGINVCGATECSSWADIEGLRAFERSLSQKYSDRLYVWESTARGFNIFHDLWTEAVSDDLTKKAIFIGWWAHDGYSYDEESPLFDKYGSFPPSEDEQQKIDLVKARYGHEVTMQQLAWYRHNHDPDIDHPEQEHAGQDIIQQELPWFEEEAFLKSGASFFPGTKLTDQTRQAKLQKASGYRYFMSEDFMATIVEPVVSLRHAHLKVWEEPDPNAVYCVGADPAFGSSEEADRFAIQILRCYADGVDQVAEYCTTEGTTQNFAWVLLHLCGVYSGQTKGARLILELNGPGNAVRDEIKTMQRLLHSGYLQSTARERGLQNIMGNVREFLFAKDDMLSQSPTAWQWESSQKRKVRIMERFRDFLNVGQMRIRSTDLIDEMQTIVRNGDQIAADGAHKDDRVIAYALALHAWEAHERKPLIAKQLTRENAALTKHFTANDLERIFNSNIVAGFFAGQKQARIRERRAIRRGTRWNF